jgi:hypothetical protein
MNGGSGYRMSGIQANQFAFFTGKCLYDSNDPQRD